MHNTISELIRSDHLTLLSNFQSASGDRALLRIHEPHQDGAPDAERRRLQDQADHHLEVARGPGRGIRFVQARTLPADERYRFGRYR